MADVTKTKAALLAVDCADARVTVAADALDYAALAAAFSELDAAKAALGVAFAEDTADRNPDRAVTARWAAFDPQRVREVLSALEAETSVAL